MWLDLLILSYQNYNFTLVWTDPQLQNGVVISLLLSTCIAMNSLMGIYSKLNLKFMQVIPLSSNDLGYSSRIIIYLLALKVKLELGLEYDWILTYKTNRFL